MHAYLTCLCHYLIILDVHDSNGACCKNTLKMTLFWKFFKFGRLGKHQMGGPLNSLGGPLNFKGAGHLFKGTAPLL